MVQHVVAHGAQEHPPDDPGAMRADHDQVEALVRRYCADGGTGIALSHLDGRRPIESHRSPLRGPTCVVSGARHGIGEHDGLGRSGQSEADIHAGSHNHWLHDRENGVDSLG